ncbi:hypothetical protein EON65_04365 [archaeon]|nr:MAG: hypothetical protein EON65_04365 [archaeon]
MSSIEEKEQENAVDDEIIREADDIASQITNMLVEAFKAKEGRDPTPEEVEQLIEEVTQERIEELLGATASTLEADAEDNSSEEGDEDQENSGIDEEDGEDENGESDEDVEEPENADVNTTNPFLSLPQGEVKLTVSGDLVKEHEENETKRRRIASD